MTPHQTEPNANNALGDLLRQMLPGSRVYSETTHTFEGFPGRHPDGLVLSPGRAPVVVEAEYEPAAEVEEDARGRLGLAITGDTRVIEAAIALRYPPAVENAYDLAAVLKTAQFSYCVHYADGPRFPQSGWLPASAADLADLIRLVSVPQKEVDKATEALENGINRAAPILDEMAILRPYITPAMAGLLGLADGPQTRRMACAIIANALVFHERLSGMHPEVKSLGQLAGPEYSTRQDAILAAWQDILDNIDYYPIFAIAQDLLTQVPAGPGAELLAALRPTAREVNAAGVDNAHDLTGRVFQRLIADRKYLATFYTRPESAALLARLAVAKMQDVDWADAAAIGRLRIGDFACGTGALLAAVYDQMAARHERAGGQAAALHPVMMEEVLYGCDVMPAAIHITGSTLSGIQPNVKLNQARLYTMPYGRQTDGSVKIGSLELLQTSAIQTLFNTSDPARRTGSVGEETAAQVIVEFPDAGFDLIIMNPPFTRNVTHEAEYAGAFAAAFAAFGASDADQKAMAQRLERYKRGTCYHGSAGMSSAFAALADKKLKPGGVLALVLPLSMAAGSSWEKFRQMLAEKYTDLEVLSIAAADNDLLSFSADTGMAEGLVVARKRRKGENPAESARFTSLRRRPPGFAAAAAIANGILSPAEIRGIADGPYGGAPLDLGDEPIAEIVTEQMPAGISPSFNAVRIQDIAVAQTAHALANSRLWLPTYREPFPLPVIGLSEIAGLGKYHLSIIGNPPQGCFTKTRFSRTASYPSLWNHNARNETRLICEPDSQLRVIRGMEDPASEVWATASRAHLNQDFRFTSQPLTAAFTERETVGGTAWPNVGFADNRWDYPFMLWCNSTLGLLSFWWHSNRQQSGRGRTTISAIATLPLLDLRALTEAQLTTAQEIFEEFRDKELQPAYLADADPNRALLDQRVICDLLGFDATVYQGVRRLAEKWCAEPSVHGGKARPKDARLVV